MSDAPSYPVFVIIERSPPEAFEIDRNRWSIGVKQR